MYRHAIIKDNVVTSIIKATDEFASSLPDTTVNIHDDDTIGIGHTYDASSNTFSAPTESTSLPTQEEFEAFEKEWRNRELTYTDALVPITDLPHYDSWMTYRQELRDWPNTDSFPNERPYPAHQSASIAEEGHNEYSRNLAVNGVQL